MGYIINPKDEFDRYCDVCGRKLIYRKTLCQRKGLDLCAKHYGQLYKYGRILDRNPRSSKDPNEYHILGELTVMDIYDKNSEVIARTVFDTEDLDKVKDIKWALNSAGYVYSSTTYFNGTKGVLMHSLILGTSDIIDHINHNILNNRKSNLRVATSSQNGMNRCTQGYTETRNNRFYSAISIDRKHIKLGTYDTKEEAIFARWYAEKVLYKEFRYPREEPAISDKRKLEIINYVNSSIVNNGFGDYLLN